MATSDQAEGVGGGGHVELRADIPRVASQDLLAVLQDAEVIPAALRPLHLRFWLSRRDEGEEPTTKVVLVLGLLVLAEFLPIDEVRRVELGSR